MAADKFKTSMERFVDKRQPRNIDELQSVLDDYENQMRVRIETELAENPNAKERAYQAIEVARKEVESLALLDKAPPEPSPSEDLEVGNTGRKTIFLSIVASFVCGALFAYMLLGPLGVMTSHSGPINSGDYMLARENAALVKDFVERFQVEIEDPSSSIEFPDSSGFHSISRLWGDEFEKIPEDARHRLAVSARKSNDAYKILLRSPFCTVAVAENTFQVDPVRHDVYSELCDIMSVYTLGAEDF